MKFALKKIISFTTRKHQLDKNPFGSSKTEVIIMKKIKL